MALSDHDRERLRRAFALARKGRFAVEPNPIVGCVIESDDGVVGESWHKAYGGAHAEVEALRMAGKRARGATAYVSLEPCCHTGKTGPCTDALIDAGIGRVVFGAVDPNPAVAGKGAERLRGAGIEVEGPHLEDEAEALLGPFRAALERDRPWVIAKWAMSLDGAITPKAGRGGAITGIRAKRHTHELRGRVDAVAVGIGTILADDSDLTCRLADGVPDGRAQPLRVVLDSSLRLPLTSKLVVSAGAVPVLVYCAEGALGARRQALESAGVRIEAMPATPAGIDVAAMLASLKSHGVDRLLVEGGASLHGTLLRRGLVDQVTAWVAPRILGGSEAVSAVTGTDIDRAEEALVLAEPMWRKVGDDLLLQGYVPS
ncbi:MAG: bifunctional diaminohydroxyphosphoribosylaminopyrimidine deaminase/5-amino-6-(5-phosphoribosylamino)uracil reductase RibD [Planctomycetota bacterium]|nr:bifunctional diaminohydroxyphosphoribosylaminopyrimidine deaminase/5-amino-6-(5-phosphoribosylamino)uracil reductase RibD [Planctomycetota bacterium]